MFAYRSSSTYTLHSLCMEMMSSYFELENTNQNLSKSEANYMFARQVSHHQN